MMTSTMMLFAQAAQSAGSCGGKCPAHAVVALVAALAVGLLIGFLLGRRGGAKKCKCAKKVQPQQQPRKRERAEPRQPAEPRAPIPAGSVEIYVGNLSYDLTEEQLRKEFEAFGTVNSARIVTYRNTAKSKGFGFVHMPNRAEADAAVAALNDKEILGRKMKCNVAKNTI